MCDIYRSLCRLPRNLVFALGPRLTTPGFRWAPSTFLEQRITGLRSTPNLASLGLATPKGFDIMALSIGIPNPWVIEPGVVYKIELPEGKTDILFQADFQDHPTSGPVSIKKPNIVVGDQMEFAQNAVVIEVTNELMGRKVLGSYAVPGFVMQMDRGFPRAFGAMRHEAIHGEYHLFLN